jgi:RNA polymerase sigma-70 factor (ECF subfamily)
MGKTRMPARALTFPGISTASFLRATLSHAARTDEVGRVWTTEDDRVLVTECLNGRREAFDVLVERHRRQVYQLCYRFVGNHEDASDLAQEVFIRAYRSLAGFRGKSAVSTWLYRIAVNLCLNRVSTKANSVERVQYREQIDDRIEMVDAALLRAERAAQVRAAIARLPKKQRATVVLRIYHELPHEEIADVLGSSVGAAKANLFHALANLRKLLKGEER